MPRNESHLGIFVVLLGSIASVAIASRPLGTLLVIAGSGWLLRDITDTVSHRLTTERVSDVDVEKPSTVDDRPGNDSEESTTGPEERTLEIIRENDGCVRQKEIVTAADLSPASVSRHIATLESKGKVEKRQIGRENVVSLDEREPSTVREGPSGHSSAEPLTSRG